MRVYRGGGGVVVSDVVSWDADWTGRDNVDEWEWVPNVIPAARGIQRDVDGVPMCPPGQIGDQGDGTGQSYVQNEYTFLPAGILVVKPEAGSVLARALIDCDGLVGPVDLRPGVMFYGDGTGYFGAFLEGTSDGGVILGHYTNGLVNGGWSGARQGRIWVEIELKDGLSTARAWYEGDPRPAVGHDWLEAQNWRSVRPGLFVMRGDFIGLNPVRWPKLHVEGPMTYTREGGGGTCGAVRALPWAVGAGLVIGALSRGGADG